MFVLLEYVGLAWLDYKEFDTEQEALDYMEAESANMEEDHREAYFYNSQIMTLDEYRALHSQQQEESQYPRNNNKGPFGPF